MGLFHEVVE